MGAQAPRGPLGGRGIERCGLGLLCLYVGVYVASNASLEFTASESPAKHFVMVVSAVVSLLLLPGPTLRSVLIFSPLALIYLLAQLPAYALMALAFAGAIPLLSRGLASAVAGRQNWALPALALVVLAPAAFSIFSLAPEALFSTYYGRPRLLLGYWHPKEAAASLAVPIFIYLLSRDRATPVLALVALPAFLWAVGSRNMALATYLAIGIRLRPRWVVAGGGLLLLGLATFILSTDNTFDLFDELLSLRFSVWSEALSDPVQVASTDLIGGDRLAIDSYYVEVFLSSGLAGLMLFAAWAGVFYAVYVRPFAKKTWSAGLFFAVLVFAAFDSGIVSTGNVFHVLGWAVVGMPIFAAKTRKRTRVAAKPVASSLTSPMRPA